MTKDKGQITNCIASPLCHDARQWQPGRGINVIKRSQLGLSPGIIPRPSGFGTA
ncbi:hypothetical protein [[Phormidium] sp. ETS-05]|uniref:hypothetical protein n=1 Tax=[Phormidium] sp. ETS-05 TaxID=222819 RepID=UPI0018EEDED2|nr:hypothetical protein [[Phormidium] sp. ETS-05]